MLTKRARVNWLGLVLAAVLTGWVMALCWLARGSGDDPLLGRFIRSDYWWLVYAAVVIFVAFLASLAGSQPRQLGPERRRNLIQAVILCLPLFYLPLALSSELSIEAAEKRSLYTPRVAVKRSESPKAMAVIAETRDQTTDKGPLHTPPTVAGRLQSEEPNGLARKAENPRGNSRPTMAPANKREPTMLDLVSDPEEFVGSDADLVGVVHKDHRLPAGSFFLYRLLMVCCAADASPIGVIVKSPESGKLNKGSWVKVHGKVGFTTFEGEDYPVISAAKVEKTTPPKNRFIIPR